MYRPPELSQRILTPLAYNLQNLIPHLSEQGGNTTRPQGPLYRVGELGYPVKNRDFHSIFELTQRNLNPRTYNLQIRIPQHQDALGHSRLRREHSTPLRRSK